MSKNIKKFLEYSLWCSKLINADWLYLIILTIVFVLVFLAPIALAYIKGAKDIGRALSLYSREIEKTIKKIKDAKIVQRTLSRNLNLVYDIRLSEIGAEMQVEISLIERRTYVYYLYKIFRTLPDIFIIRINLEKRPSTSLIIIPRKKQKIISKIMKYLSQLQEIKVKQLSKEIIFSSDDSRYGSKYLTRKILELVYNIRDSLNFIFIDYNPPHIEINCEIIEKRAEKIIDASLRLATLLSKSIKEMKIPGRKTEALKFIRRSLESPR